MEHEPRVEVPEQQAARFLAAYAQHGTVDRAIRVLASEDEANEIPEGERVTAWRVSTWRSCPSFARQYREVRRALGTKAAERTVDVAEATLAGEYHPAAAQVHQRALQWYAARADREEWGDRTDGRLEITGRIEHRQLGGELAAHVEHLLEAEEEEPPRPQALPPARQITADTGRSGFDPQK